MSITAGEQGLLSASDAEQMERATTLDRALVTADQDLLAIVRDMHAAAARRGGTSKPDIQPLFVADQHDRPGGRPADAARTSGPGLPRMVQVDSTSFE